MNRRRAFRLIKIRNAQMGLGPVSPLPAMPGGMPPMGAGPAPGVPGMPVESKPLDRSSIDELRVKIIEFLEDDITESDEIYAHLLDSGWDKVRLMKLFPEKIGGVEKFIEDVKAEHGESVDEEKDEDNEDDEEKDDEKKLQDADKEELAKDEAIEAHKENVEEFKSEE